MSTYADDPYAQSLADEIERSQKSADAERALLAKTKSDRMRVGCAMQHAYQQALADRARAELIRYTGMTLPALPNPPIRWAPPGGES